MSSDPIADLFTRIRNAYKAQKNTVEAPFSRNKMDILEVLKKHRFILDYAEIKDEKNEAIKDIKITLNPEKREIMIKRISKPGQRIYIKKSNISKLNGGLGISIISTSKGIMNGEEAKKNQVGGEFICEVF
jgi:small subunit ribosomal protein S8